METLRKKLDSIHGIGNEVIEVTQNYTCGFITLEEMMMQISHLHGKMISLKFDIKDEYKIDLKAVELMLTL